MEQRLAASLAYVEDASTARMAQAADDWHAFAEKLAQIARAVPALPDFADDDKELYRDSFDLTNARAAVARDLASVRQTADGLAADYRRAAEFAAEVAQESRDSR